MTKGHQVANYKLTAHLGRDMRTKTIHADSKMDATFQAIAHIMDAAHKDQDGPWANGQIFLEDPQGFVFHSMDAKA